MTIEYGRMRPLSHSRLKRLLLPRSLPVFVSHLTLLQSSVLNPHSLAPHSSTPQSSVLSPQSSVLSPK
ncbi:hypothetical protein H6F50_23165 [Coleofasciculus sp. FACHB-712]|uniref:hypothetical protein n=1 Tax=Coleofasciculus sp. FACHB-712 TaxID=2692789 RepID=UPI0016858C6B|nr:hypothetical protein [Coleofasciculus sp. FACHB-712]MBD1945214.1 hypothetical protein [Coleofasciculus sp. FACHB-712]